MKAVRFLLLIVLTSVVSAALADEHNAFPGYKGQWNGFDNYEFTVDTPFGARPCRVVCPKEPAEGNPWVFRAVFFGPAS